MPTADSDKVEGRPVHSGATSAARASSRSAAISASAPESAPIANRREGSDAASSISQPDQPISAATWLRKVAEGGTLKAISAGATTAAAAATRCISGAGPSVPGGLDGRDDTFRERTGGKAAIVRRKQPGAVATSEAVERSKPCDVALRVQDGRPAGAQRILQATR